MTASQTETTAMRRAVELAALGLGTASPNPVVGCVVLNAAGQVAGEGWHERPGTPHAEVHALRAAGLHARGGTAVVTLEPCNHFGCTPRAGRHYWTLEWLGSCTQWPTRTPLLRVARPRCVPPEWTSRVDCSPRQPSGSTRYG